MKAGKKSAMYKLKLCDIPYQRYFHRSVANFFFN